MDPFKLFAQAVTDKLYTLSSDSTAVMISDVPKDKVWETYLESIPAEHNPVFRERRTFDANYDKNFINKFGRLVFIVGGKRHTIWEVETGTFFDQVAKDLQLLIEKETNSLSFFLTSEKTGGHKPNLDEKDPSILWEHLYAETPSKLYDETPSYTLSGANTSLDVFNRSMNDYQLSALENVLELIDEGILYRGSEKRQTIEKWIKAKKEFDKAKDKQAFSAHYVAVHKNRSRFKSDVIEVLVSDLQSGIDLEKAVDRYGNLMDPANYRRTTSLVTPKMVEKAKETISNMGYMDSIYRRGAVDSDVPVTEKLYSAREGIAVDVFDDLSADARKRAGKINPDALQNIKLTDLINELGTARSLEILPNESLNTSQVVLTAPLYNDSPSMFSWGNSIGWAYVGSDTTDAIRERVKSAGGNVEGDVRVSLAWHNADDLDLHAHSSQHRDDIYFSNRKAFGGTLDVDMNAGMYNNSVDPVENIYWETKELFPTEVRFYVDQFCKRSSSNVGFDLQVVIGENTTIFRYDKPVTRSHKPSVTLKREGGSIVIDKYSDSLTKISETTNASNFVHVESVFLSPNFWGNSTSGNKHFIFQTKDFEIDQPVRGFFNEYLEPSLKEHRKVFEIMGQKTKISDSMESAVRGYGFSVDSGKEFVVRVNGNKLYKVSV